MNCLKSNKGLSVTSSAGFSIVEVMVVVMIIALLTTLAGNRVLSMIARARQAEARTNLSQIHQLQGTYQLHADNYAAWPLDENSAVGYKGDGTHNCTIATCANTAAAGCDGASGDGAKLLGYEPKGCKEMRYGYGIKVASVDGKERFVAFAFAASDTEGRIFPTCDGAGRSNDTTVAHPISTYSTLTFTPTAAKLGVTTIKEGDLIGVTDEKEWVHDDIIKVCSE